MKDKENKKLKKRMKKKEEKTKQVKEKLKKDTKRLKEEKEKLKRLLRQPIDAYQFIDEISSFKELRRNDPELQLKDLLDVDSVVLFVDLKHSKVWLWCGYNTTIRMKFIAAKTAPKIRDKHGADFKITAVDQGKEPHDFLVMLGLTEKIDDNQAQTEPFYEGATENEELFKELKEEKSKLINQKKSKNQEERFYNLDKDTYLLRIAVLGSKNVGKRTFAKSNFIDSFSDLDYMSTTGVEHSTKTVELDETQVKLLFRTFSDRKYWWDKNEKFTLHVLLRGLQGAILLYDITNTSSLEQVPHLIHIVKDNAGDIPIILVGTKLDLNQKRTITNKEIEIFKNNYEIKASIEISAESGENMEKLFSMITRMILDHFKGKS